jgi:hypothetical protein
LPFSLVLDGQELHGDEPITQVEEQAKEGGADEFVLRFSSIVYCVCFAKPHTLKENSWQKQQQIRSLK